jgi:hypothetical protein
MCYNILSGEFNSFALNQSFFVYFRLRYNKEIDISSYAKLNPRRYVTQEFLHEYLKNGARKFISLWGIGIGSFTNFQTVYLYPKTENLTRNE